MLTVRRSVLQALVEECPAKGWALLDAPDENVVSRAAERGTIIHKVFERFVRGLGFEEPNPQALLEIAQEEMGKAVLTYGDRCDIEAQVGNLSRFQLDYSDIVMPEVQLEVEMRGFKLTGRVDLIQINSSGDLLITDLKTQRNIPTAAEAADSFQLRTYALMAREVYDPSAVSARFWMTRYGTMVPREPIVYDYGELERFRAHLEDSFQAALKVRKNPPRIPGAWCTYCPLSKCSLQRLTAANAPRTKAQAQKIAARILAYEDAIGRLRDHLAQWVAVNGPIDVGDQRFDYFQRVEETVDARDAFNLLSEIGVDDPFLALRVDKRSSVWKQARKGFSEALEAITETSYKTVFTHKKQED